MPVPFGVSPGDFISGIDLIRSVCEALKDSTGSVAQYQGVVSALRSLEKALEELNSISATNDEKLVVEEILSGAKQTLVRFDSKIRKYQNRLGNGQTAAWWRSLLRKIQWQRYTCEDLRELQHELLQHHSALQMVLAKIQNAANARACQRTDDAMSRFVMSIDQSAKATQMHSAAAKTELSSKLDQLEGVTQSCFDQVETRASDRFHQNESRAANRFRSSEAAAETRFDAAQHMYRNVMQCLFLLYICMLHNMEILRRTLDRIPRPVLRQASTIFEDAHGYICHIYIDFVRSWEAFSFVVSDNFKDQPGRLRVLNGKYQLYDRFGSKQIMFSQPIRSVLRPGRHIRQSIYFEWNEVSFESCPKCKRRQATATDAEIRCENLECGFCYRKLEKTELQVPTRDADMTSSKNGYKPNSEDLDKPEDFTRIVIGPDPVLEPQLVCLTCGNKYDRSSDLVTHKQIHLSEEKRLQSLDALFMEPPFYRLKT